MKKILLITLLFLSGSGLRLFESAAMAQNLTTLHSFTAYDINDFNSDGFIPAARLVLAGNTLYGTALFGGSSGDGTVFSVNTDGTGFTTMYNFTDSSDGDCPRTGLLLAGNTLYGTAEGGGTYGCGTVFSISTNGTGFTTLHSFAAGSGPGPDENSDGFSPAAGLILSTNTLYGTAIGGGSSGFGTVFAVNTNGTGFTVLHNFSESGDGGLPTAGLVLAGNTLYGTTVAGGTYNGGTVFAVNTDGTGFTTLFNFGSEDLPNGRLFLSGTTLYGTAGGDTTEEDGGQVFAIKTDGTGFTNLYNFSGLDAYGCNSDGFCANGVILSNNILYGVATSGGSHGYGTVFAVNTNGTGFTTIYNFTGGSDGAYPYATADGSLLLSSNILYGTTYGGGIYGNGTVFAVNSGSSINVQFAGSDGQATKTGAAGAGFPGDYWNVMPALDGSEESYGGVYASIACVDNFSNSTPITVELGSEGDAPYGLPCGDAIGTNVAAATDPLMQGWETEDSGSALDVGILGLDPQATYDIYFYGVAQDGYQRRAAQFEVLTNSAPGLAVGGSPNPQNTSSNLDWYINTWQEGNQYVVFRNVNFAAYTNGSSRDITIRFSGQFPGGSGFSVINGLQIVPHY